VFAFGGIKSTDPLVWDIRDIKEVRTQFYPRMNMNEDEEEIAQQEEKEKQKRKRADRARKFKEIVSKSSGNAYAPDTNESTSKFNRRPKLKK
jgi:hypothetical protein